MGQGHSQAKVAVAFPFLKSPSCESHRCEFTRKMGKMISTANQEQVKDFFDVVREKHGVKAEDYCRTWIETNNAQRIQSRRPHLRMATQRTIGGNASLSGSSRGSYIKSYGNLVTGGIRCSKLTLGNTRLRGPHTDGVTLYR
jgi:hypothetical protein